MSLFQSVLKQYTTPTCNLEILSSSSATETSLPGIQKAPESFQLKIHPPLPVQNGKGSDFLQSDTEEPTILTIVVRGTVEQLQSLHAAIQNYLQGFLAKANVPALAATSTPGPIRFPVDPPRRSSPAVADAGIKLQPRGLTQHTLQLGSLVASPSVSAIELASTQLFDLVGTLDRYARDVPTPATEPQRQLIARPSGARKQGLWIAATALAALGLAGLAKVLPSFQGPALQVASQSATDEQRDAPNVNNTFQPGILPGLPTGTPAPNGLASGLPTPTGTPGATPSSAIPTPNPSQTLSVPGIPVPSSTSLPTAIPTAIPAGAESVAPGAKQSSSSFAQSLPKPVSGALKPVPPTFAIASRSPQLEKARGSNSAAKTYPPVSGSAFKPVPPAASRPPQTGIIPQANPAARAQPFEPFSPAAPPVSAARDAAAETAARTTPTETAARDAGGGTVFDITQQVREVRDYFQPRWTPPSGLDQVLEYQLSVNSDGSLWKIAPLGEAAGRYIDRTGMPLLGVPFVSPIPNRQRATVRLVLSPDGKVQTFFEGLSQ